MHSAKHFLELFEMCAPYDDPQKAGELLRLMENLYFRRRSRWYIPWSQLQEVKFARDIVILDHHIRRGDSLLPTKWQSQEIANNPILEKYSAGIDEASGRLILSRVVEPNRLRVTAVLLTEIILHEARQERVRWTIATLLGLLIALLAAIAKLLEEIGDAL